MKNAEVIMLFLCAIAAFFVLNVPGECNDTYFGKVTFPEHLTPQLALLGPSRVQTGKAFDLFVVSLGSDSDPIALSKNPLITYEGPLSPLSNDTPDSFTLELESIESGQYHLSHRISLSKEGYYLFTARDTNNEFVPCGLPIHVTKEKPEMQLHWADLHGHSTLSDGARSPEEYYHWARNIARLDAVALTDHNWALNEEKIEIIRRLANEWYEPGVFVPFMGFEWAMGKARPHPSRGRPNHKHLLFRTTTEKFVPWTPWLDTPSVDDLWKLCEGRDVIAIPHHSGLPYDTFYGTDWTKHDERFERLVEVFSDWGSSEVMNDLYPLPEVEAGNFIRDVLKQSYHLGIVGGSDTHTSRPGLNALPHAGHPYALTSLTAIQAPARTRQALWSALYNRQCYATSCGRRILLEFTLNGAPMGSRITESLTQKPRHLRITVAGSTSIKEIIIVKNGKVAASFPGNRWLQSIEWTDNIHGEMHEDSYYVRAEMHDTSMAWSSPIWVASPSLPDISAETRLWRLDADVCNRDIRTIDNEMNDLRTDNPMTICDLQGTGTIDRIIIEGKGLESEDSLRSAKIIFQVDNETTHAIHSLVDQFFFLLWVENPFRLMG